MAAYAACSISSSSSGERRSISASVHARLLACEARRFCQSAASSGVGLSFMARDSALCPGLSRDPVAIEAAQPAHGAHHSAARGTLEVAFQATPTLLDERANHLAPCLRKEVGDPYHPAAGVGYRLQLQRSAVKLE